MGVALHHEERQQPAIDEGEQPVDAYDNALDVAEPLGILVVMHGSHIHKHPDGSSSDVIASGTVWASESRKRLLLWHGEQSAPNDCRSDH